MKQTSSYYLQYILYYCLVAAFLLTFSQPLLAQNTQERFGTNRLQHKDFNWKYLSTPNFEVYHYDYGARLANFATRFLETEFYKITKILGYNPSYKSKIFIYNSVSDLQQSNVGIDNDQVVIGGQTEFLKSQIEIPYTGSEEEFKRELRRGVALLLVREMMFGGSLKDMLQSSYLGKFSEWFLLGAAAYVAEGWNEEMDDHMRDLMRRRRIKKPSLLEGEDAILVGQSIWNFIAQEYGEANIANILNLARIIRNERNSIGSTLGLGYRRFLDRWQTYYEQANESILENGVVRNYDFKLKKGNRRGFIFNEFKINPNGSKIAYSEMRNGRYRIIVQNLQNQKRKVLFRNGYRAIGQRYDYNIPLLSWRDNNNLGIAYVHKGENRLLVLNPKKKKTYQRDWEFFNHISGFDFSDDGNFIVLSADRKGDITFNTGQNDLFLFDVEKVNLQVITNDWFDDEDPVFLPNSNSAFVFSSNRTNDTLSTANRTTQGNFDKSLNNYRLYTYDPRESSTRVAQITKGVGRDMKPRFLDEKTLVYLNDDSGLLQLYKMNLETKVSQKLTNFRQSVRRFEVNPLGNGLAYLMVKRGRTLPYYIKEFDFNQSFSNDFQSPRARKLLNQNPASLAQDTSSKKINTPEGFEPVSATQKEVYGPDEIDTDNYVFDPSIAQDKKSGLEKAQETMLERVQNSKKNEIRVIGPYDYEHRFRTETLLTTFTIDPLRGFGIIGSFVASDLLENHKIRGGGFLGLDFRSSSYYGEYQYLAKRLDYTLRVERDNFRFLSSEYLQAHSLNSFKGTISYPIRNTARISITPTYLWLNSMITGRLGGSTLLYSAPNHNYHYGGAKVEYVYDNTTVNGQNMIAGTRLKVAYERYFGITMSQALKDVGANIANIGFDKITVDVRHYFKIHKDLIFATRVFYGRFGGAAPKSFLLGGMDNWILNNRDTPNSQQAPRELIAANIDTSPVFENQNNDFTNRDFLSVNANANGDFVVFGNENVVFNEFVTNLRGFNLNKIAGENVFVANLELRFPFIKYLFGKRVNSNFFKNMQLVGFYDIGSAWTGISPFNRENSQNTRIVSAPSPIFEATVNDFKNPWLVGYGVGLRTVLAGYYLKADLAWALEDFVVADRPRLYLTFGYDF